MRKLWIIILSSAGLFTVSHPVAAQEAVTAVQDQGTAGKESGMTAPEQGTPAPKAGAREDAVETGPDLTGEEVGNTVCPVMGTPIVEKYAVKVKYQGKIYNLCCTSCLEEFKAHPDKFAAIAAASMEGKQSAGTGTSGFQPMSGSMQARN